MKKGASNPEADIEDRLLEIIQDYERGFKERAQKRQKQSDLKLKQLNYSQSDRTVGKHVYSLCYACKKGVCSFIKFSQS